ncbi:HlyD family secretion protein [Amantichitinum ursilacus]|uniref:Multidrug export protein EmrA n=1 Tax=Amantichitinum ursilacus TaxID=857265 RepID=A0A0N1JRS1_9NEIS|nr:HlyD family efflux transporter periplasmic adaptor subunit [Amantichitinum ursilacus]KPC49784.1 Multidrug export protein EmrA [Amantichitinum ursilacus]
MSNEQQQAAPQKPSRRTFLLRLVALIVVIGAVAWAFWYYTVGRWNEDTDDAYVQGNVVQITPQVPGTVTSIGADNGALVKVGQQLVALDPSDAHVAMEQAKANLARTVRQVRGLFSNVNSLQAQVAAQNISLQKAKQDYDRRLALAKTGAISAEELSHAQDALATAQSAVASYEGQLSTSKVLVEDTVVASHPDVQAAAAKLRSAYLDDVRTNLQAPVTGYVAQRTVQVGQRVQPGTPLMAVVPLNQVWVEANFKETQLQHMRIGQPVTLKADLYGSGVEYHGKVESLGVGTGSAFSLLPAQNATGNWIKIVQRIPVRITLDPKELEAHPLRIGLSMAVDVELHNQDGPALSQTAATTPVFTTDIYKQQLAAADQLIADVIHSNLPTTVAKK